MMLKVISTLVSGVYLRGGCEEVALQLFKLRTDPDLASHQSRVEGPDPLLVCRALR